MGLRRYGLHAAEHVTRAGKGVLKGGMLVTLGAGFAERQCSGRLVRAVSGQRRPTFSETLLALLDC